MRFRQLCVDGRKASWLSIYVYTYITYLQKHTQKYTYIFDVYFIRIVQQTNTGTRPIQQVAKVKAVYVKTAVGVQKLDEIFVKKDSSTVEKIHQSVPTAQLNK